MTCDICGVRDILAKMSSFDLFFVREFWRFLKCIDKFRVKNIMRIYEKQIQINLQK